MERHVAMAAEREAVGYIIAKVRIIGIALDMVCCETTLIFLALATAALADIVVTFEYSVAPGKIFGLLEALPRAAAFPVVVAIAATDTTITTFGFELLRLRSVGYSSPLRFRSNLGSRLLREASIKRTLSLNLGLVLETLFQSKLSSPPLDSPT
jgi:hypothetical protein